MSRYSGKVLTVFITRDGVRVCEGENRNGNPDISKFFTVSGVSEYFAVPSNNAPPEIINMSGLVGAIVSECKNRNVTSKRVMVCSDCFGITTDISLSDSIGGLKSVLTGDIKSLKLKRPNEKPQTPDKIVCNQFWGDLTIDGVVKKINTTSIGDKYMLRSLVQEFYEYDYEVVFISGAQEVLFNFRQTEPASFDSQGKIIFDYDVFCGVSVFVKDVPVEVTHLAMLEKEQISERLHSQLNQAVQKTGRNPKIYLTGSVFQDTQLYGQIIDELENDGYVVYDLFNRPSIDDNYQALLERGDIEPVMTPDYSANIAMLMCPFAKTLISMTPALEVSDVFRKNSKAVATIVLGFGCACAAVAVVFAGIRLFNLYQMNSNPAQVDSLQSRVMSLTSQQQSLNSTIQTLTQADTTVLELMKFIDVNQSDRVSVISVDTRDMLTNEVAVDTNGVTVTQTPETAAVDTSEISGTAGGVSSGGRENIVIRGYSKTGNEAVSYYNRLFKYGLPSDPILNGVERYILPDGEEVYVFEIEIGGGAQ